MWLEYARETLRQHGIAPLYEPVRPSLAQRYLKAVRYSNTHPLALDDDVLAGVLPGDLRWCFHMLLDYGDHADPPRIEPDRPWRVRMDPTTTTRPGFDVRTYRLCRRILSFHDFDELDGAALIGAVSFVHDENASGTTLRQIDYTGYRRDDGAITTAAVPPLVMSYAPAAMDH